MAKGTSILFSNFGQPVLFLLVLSLCVVPSMVQGQDVIKASGGTDLSIDSVATGGFYPIDGPTIRETAAGQLAGGGTIVLTLPSGYTWNTALISDDLTITIVPTGAANTKLSVSFTSISTSKATFTIDNQSEVNGNGQGPGRIEIQGLELRPTTTEVPQTGQISNTGSTGPDLNYGNLSTSPGSISQVRVETKADGTGQIVPSQDLLAGESLTVYAIARDVGDNFIKNIALNSESDWALTGGDGSISQTALTASDDLKSATFSSQQTGTTKIQASYPEATSVTSQLITVLPRSAQSMSIKTQPSDTVTAGTVFPTQPVIYLRDQFGNKVTTDNSTQVTASINSGSGSLSGTLTQTASGGEVAFSGLKATIADTVTLKFESSGLSTVASNGVVVLPTVASDLSFIQQPNNTAQNSTITPPVTVQLLDEFGNKVHESGTTITINGDEPFFKNSSTLTDTTSAQGIATYSDLNLSNNATVGEHHLTAQISGMASSVSSDPFLIVSANQLAQYQITDLSGDPISEQQAGNSFHIRITALDGAGNTKTDFTGTVAITADAAIQINGTQQSSFATDNFQSGVLDTAITLTSTGSTKIYADQNEDVTGESNRFSVTPSDSIDATKSTISADPTSITADGNSTSTITVQLKDEFGNNLETGGETVILATTSGTLANNGNSQDENDGSYTAVLTSSTTAGETATITGTVNSSSLSDNAKVDFTAGEVTGFAISLPGAPDTQTAGVSFDIAVQAVDAQGNVVPGFNGPVTFSSNSTISSGGSATFNSGTLQNHSITLTEADSSVTLTATADNLYNISGTSQPFIVKPNSPDAATSQVTATPSVLQNDNTSKSAISVILTDAYGNRVYQPTTVSLNLEQIELNNAPSSGNPDAVLIYGNDIPFNAERGIYHDTLSAANTVEKVEITAEFGSSPVVTISQKANVDIVIPNTWTAAAGGPSGNRTDWTNPDNWSQNQVPGSGDFVIIPNIGDLPILDLNITIGSFEIQTGANLTLFGGNAISVSGNTIINGSLNIEDNTELTVGGNLTGDGSFTAGASTDIDVKGNISLANFIARSSGANLTLNGASRQTISTSSFLAQNLNIQNNVNADGNNNLIDTAVLTIGDGYTFELDVGAQDTLDVAREITGQGKLIINDNAIVLGGDIDLNELDTSEGTVIFGVRQALDPTNYDLSEQQILNLSGMKNAVINNDHGVKTFEDIIVDGTLTLENGELIISSGKSLIAPHQIYNNGKLTILRTIDAYPGWRMISAPINTDFADLFDGLTVQGISGSTYSNRQPTLLYYDETVSGTDNQRWRAPSAMSDAIHTVSDSTSRGFFFYVFGDVNGDSDYNDNLPVTLRISGEEFLHQNINDTYTFSPVTYTAEADTGWNLVGNPWAATIDWDDGNWTKQNMDNVIYVWDPASNDYLTWNGISGSLENGLIKPFQAFWVKANGDGTPMLAVNKSSKTTGGTFYRKSKKEPASIGFKLEAGALSKQMHITLSPDGKNSKDPRDGYRLLPFDTNTYLEFYTAFEDGTQLAINNLARSFGKKITIPIYVGGFKKGRPINGEYTISWPDFGDVPKEWTLLLEDKKTGKKIDLRKNTFYSFNLSQSKEKRPLSNTIENFQLVAQTPVKAKAKNNSGNRFVLHIAPGADAAGLPEEYSLGINYPNPFKEQTTIKYNTPVEGKVQILIYDILGRKVKTVINERQPADFHETKWNPGNLASGIYICVMRGGGKQFARKITYIK